MKHQVVTDPEFGFKRLDPIPTTEEVEKLYLDEFYSQNAAYFNNSSLQIQLEQTEFQSRRWQRIIDVCAELDGDGVQRKTVFDIGFGFAQALKYFREKGYSVSGLEPSPEGVAYAREQGIVATRGGIDDLQSIDPGRSDLVLFLNVLEHLREPAQTLCAIRQKLMHSKSMLVVEVPNDFNDFQTAANQEFGLDEWWVLAPNHINYFSHTSLKNLLRDCGYRVVHSEASFPLELFLLFGDVYVGNGTLGKSCHEKRTAFEAILRKQGKTDKLNQFNRAMAELDLGRSAIVYAVPEAS